MKAINLLKIGSELLKLMSICDLRVNDWQYIEMYSEYVKKRNNHIKYEVIIMQLAKSYNISESSVKRVIRRFDREVNF
jgi:DNA-directed RNA polymerase delta subunit